MSAGSDADDFDTRRSRELDKLLKEVRSALLYETPNEELTTCCASQQEEKRARKHIKLLLLGAGASGKSTVLKQMRLIHNVTFTEEEIEGGSIYSSKRDMSADLYMVAWFRLQTTRL